MHATPMHMRSSCGVSDAVLSFCYNTHIAHTRSKHEQLQWLNGCTSPATTISPETATMSALPTMLQPANSCLADTEVILKQQFVQAGQQRADANGKKANELANPQSSFIKPADSCLCDTG